MLLFYEILLIIGLVIELYFISVSLNSIKSLNTTFDQINDGETVKLSYIETQLAQKFNGFFFGAQSTCTG